ncbi:MAG: helix-turn-helix transcriptional regulator, partial [Acaryochloridaceae cyanobacterium CSU_3_4]|nr:helix-turn-helix transcriptional regulator [Acaryochloridaceae cyanobacterium CSU_3_4]
SSLICLFNAVLTILAFLETAIFLKLFAKVGCSQMLAARSRAGLTQEVVARRMGTTKSAVSRLESAGQHSPSIASLKKYAAAVGCTLKIELIPQSQNQASIETSLKPAAAQRPQCP